MPTAYAVGVMGLKFDIELGFHLEKDIAGHPPSLGARRELIRHTTSLFGAGQVRLGSAPHPHL